MSNVDDSISLSEAATILARALQADERWSAWNAAAVAFEQDEELHGALDRYKQLVQKAQAEQEGGEALTAEEVSDVAVIQKTIQQNESFVAQNEATTRLLQMLEEANQLISAELGMDFAATAAPRTTA